MISMRNHDRKVKDINTNDKLLQKVKESEEYRQNQMQIDCIKKVMIENGDIPEILVDWLINSVRDNTKLEYSAIYKEISKKT